MLESLYGGPGFKGFGADGLAQGSDFGGSGFGFWV